MSDDWFVRKGNKVYGPHTLEDLKRASSSRRIQPGTLVRRGPTGSWVAARKLTGLKFAASDRDEVSNVTRPGQSNSRFGVPLPLKTAIALIGGAAVLVAVVLIAFELGRQQSIPIAKTEQFEGHVAQAEPANALEQKRLKKAIAPRNPPARQAERVAPASAILLPSGNPKVANARRVAAGSNIVHRQPVIAIRPSLIPAIAEPKPIRKVGVAVANSPVPAPPKVLPLPAKQKVPAKDADLYTLEAAAGGFATAKEALALYDQFPTTHSMTAAQQTTFDGARRIWAERAKIDLVRLGNTWVTQAEAKQARETAAQLYEQAYEMIKVLNFQEARKTLQKASRVDPDSIAADFSLGLLNSITPPSFRHAPTAAKHFHVVLRRMPAYVPALNNLAIAEIRQDKYAEALRHLREAVELAPTAEEVTQNLGRFVSEAKLGRIHPSARVLADATKVYSKVITLNKGAASTLKSGWRFIPLITPKVEREGFASIQPQAANAPIWDSAQGTGFVVAAHYLLTCRHVVDDEKLGLADRVEIVDPTDTSRMRRLPATCVTVSSEDDLALIKCDELDAPPVPIAPAVPPRGTEILLMAYPGGSDFGLGLKTTRGIVTALPGAIARDRREPVWANSSRKLVYDAASSHGASGGAVCNDHAAIVAVHSTGFVPGGDSTNAKYAGGVPSTYVIPFLKKSIPTIEPRETSGDALKWTEVDGRISPSVVLIIVGYRKMSLLMAGNSNPPANKRGSRNSAVPDIYDDRVCTACDGLGRIRCRAPGCHNGVMYVDVTNSGAMNIGSASKPVIISAPYTTTTTHRCPVCNGTGYVKCPCCVNGTDPLLH